MSNIENKENDATCQDDHANKLNGETSTPRPKFRRSVLRAFDPIYQSPGVNIKTLVADEEELFEDAQSSLPTTLHPFKDALLIPELDTGKPLSNLNDTEDQSFAECIESPSQISKSLCYNISSSEDEVEFNYKIKSPTKALSKSTTQNENILIQLEPISEAKQLNKTFEGTEDAVGDHQIVFVDIQLDTTMEGTTLTGQHTGDGDLDPLDVDNDQESVQSLNEDISVVRKLDDSDSKLPNIEQDILHSENDEDLINVEKLHGKNLQQDVEFIQLNNQQENSNAAQDNKESILHSKLNTTPTHHDVDNVQPSNIQQDISESIHTSIHQKTDSFENDISPLETAQEISEAEHKEHLLKDVNFDGTPENQSFTGKEQDTKAARDNEELVSESEVNTAQTRQDIETISTDLKIGPVENKEMHLIQPRNEPITVEQQKTNAHSDLEQNTKAIRDNEGLVSESEVNTAPTRQDIEAISTDLKIGPVENEEMHLIQPRNEPITVEQQKTNAHSDLEQDTKAARDNEELVSESEVNTAPTRQDIETISTDLKIGPVENKEMQLIQPRNESITVEQQKTNAHSDSEQNTKAARDNEELVSESEVNTAPTRQDIETISTDLTIETVENKEPQTEILNGTYSQEEVQLIQPLNVSINNESFTVERPNLDSKVDTILTHRNVDKLGSNLDPSDIEQDISQSENKLKVETYSQDDIESKQSNSESFTVEQHNTHAGQDNKEPIDASHSIDSDLKPLENEKVFSQFNIEDDSLKVENLNGTYLQEDVDSNNRSFTVERQNSNAVQDDKELNLDDSNADEQVEVPARGSISDTLASGAVNSIHKDSSLTAGKSNDFNRTFETSMNENKPIASLNIADPENAIEELARSLNQTIDVEESAIVDDLNVTDASNNTLNNTLEIVKENSEDVPKNLDAVIDKDSSITAVETPGITMEKLLYEKRTEMDPLKNKLDKLTAELAKWKEDNMRCDQQILTEALARQAELDKIQRYKKVAEQYEQEVTRQNETFFSYRLETERDRVRLASTEMAFSVLFNKYEKTKTVIEACVKNESILKENIEQTERLAESAAAKYAAIQERHKQNIKRLKEQAKLEQEAYRQEIAKLKTMAKRFEIKIGSLENSIKQKCEEAVALSQLCDEMTGRPPT